MSPQRYQRPHLPWIKRRARRLLRAFPVTRQEAVKLAAQDYFAFVGPARPTLVVVHGGRP